MKIKSRVLALALFTLFTVFLLSGCSKGMVSSDDTDKSDEGLKVIASFYAAYDMASEICKDMAKVECIMPTGASPHDFSPTARDIKRISEADVFILNGGGMEHWADSIDALKNTNVLTLSDGLIKDEKDPHTWLSLKAAKEYYKKIADEMIRLDSDNKEGYLENLRNINKEADELILKYNEAGLDGKKLFVTHGAYGYLCRDFNMEQVALEGMFGEADPTPKRMAQVLDEIKRSGAKCIFYDPSESDRLYKAVAEETGVMALPLLTLGTDADNKSYIEAMEYNLEQLKKGL